MNNIDVYCLTQPMLFSFFLFFFTGSSGSSLSPEINVFHKQLQLGLKTLAHAGCVKGDQVLYQGSEE